MDKEETRRLKKEDQEIFWEACKVGLTKGCSIWDLLFILETQLKNPWIKAIDYDNKALKLALNGKNSYVVSFLLDYSVKDDTPIEKLSADSCIDDTLKFLMIFTDRIDICERIIRQYPRHDFMIDILIIWESLTVDLQNEIKEKQLLRKFHFLLSNKDRFHYRGKKARSILSEFCIKRLELLSVIKEKYDLLISLPLRYLMSSSLDKVNKYIIVMKDSSKRDMSAPIRLYHSKSDYNNVMITFFNQIILGLAHKTRCRDILLLVKRGYPDLFPFKYSIDHIITHNLLFLLTNDMILLTRKTIDQIGLIITKEYANDVTKNFLLRFLWDKLPEFSRNEQLYGLVNLFVPFIGIHGKKFMHEMMKRSTMMKSIVVGLNYIRKYMPYNREFDYTHRLVCSCVPRMGFYNKMDEIMKYPKPLLSSFINHYTARNPYPRDHDSATYLFLMVFFKALSRKGMKEWPDVLLIHPFFAGMITLSGIKARNKLGSTLNIPEKRLLKIIDTLSECYICRDYEWILGRNFKEYDFLDIRMYYTTLNNLYKLILRISKKIQNISLMKKTFISESDPRKKIRVPKRITADKCSGKTMKGINCKSIGKFLFNRRFYCGIHIKKLKPV